jgi:hypothetical protein
VVGPVGTATAAGVVDEDTAKLEDFEGLESLDVLVEWMDELEELDLDVDDEVTTLEDFFELERLDELVI